MRPVAFVLELLLCLSGCGDSVVVGVWFSSDWPADALYVLPYPPFTSYTCLQGFNGAVSHQGVFLYAVDFAMPIGTPVTAARSGRVVYVQGIYTDEDHLAGHENLVIVLHDDSTSSRYVHLTRNGAQVSVGQDVRPGDPIGLSGNSGASRTPHLHFDVTRGGSDRNAQTIPFYFRNTTPHPEGLQSGTSYMAWPY